MDFNSDLIRGSVETIILQLLNERRMYGYEIIKVVNERTDGAFAWKEGTLYPALHGLEGRGFIRGRWAEAPAAEAPGRQRKYYSITHKGRAELARRAEEWRQFSMAVNACLLGGAL